MKSFFQIITIQAAPAEVWQALVDPEKVSRYHLVPLKRIEANEAGEICYGVETGDFIAGRILRFEPGRRLEHTFRFLPNHPTAAQDPETTVSYLLEKTGGGTTLSLSHSGFPDENQTYADISGGWPGILGRLKDLLEGSLSKT